MDNNDLQNLFFQQVKLKLPTHLSLVDEVAELLGISNDSAYRRIRGEKQIALKDLKLLSLAYNISIDELIGVQSNSFVFYGNLADNSSFDFENYLNQILENIKRVESLPGKQLYFDAKDIPMFHHFQFSHLAAFKYFFWQRVVLQDLRQGKKIFNPDEFMGPLNDIGRKIYESYVRIPSNELWNHETINSTFKQIEFCFEAGMFQNQESMLLVYDELMKLTMHLEAEAETGEKFYAGSKPAGNTDNFKLYINQVLLGNNTILADSQTDQLVAINHSTVNFMLTWDKTFFDYTLSFMKNMIRKSNLISIVNEKERRKFFNVIKDIITAKRNSFTVGD